MDKFDKVFDNLLADSLTVVGGQILEDLVKFVHE
jgi:hypothetical protein